MAVPFAGEFVFSTMYLKMSGLPYIDQAVLAMPTITLADTICKKLTPYDDLLESLLLAVRNDFSVESDPHTRICQRQAV